MQPSIEDCVPNKLPQEKIIYFIRRHWFIFLKILLVIFLLSLMPLLLYLGLHFYLPTVWEFYSGPIILSFGIYLLVLLAFSLVSWINYYFDIIIITNRRILDIEQHTLFNRSIAEVEMIHVEDVSVEVKGFFATFFNYGTIAIQTAGEMRNFIFDHVPHAYETARGITKLYDELTMENHNNHNALEISKKDFSVNKLKAPRDDELLEFKKLRALKDKFK